MSKAMSGLIGSFAGGLEGYSAGKLGEIKNYQESNMMLIKDIMDRKNKEFEHRLGLERIGVEDQYARGRMELGQDFDVENMKSSQLHDLNMAEKEFRQQLERDTIQFGRQFALEKYQQSMANARASMSAGTRAKFNDYINPTTGETRQISEGDHVPQGFFPASYAASIGKVEEYKLGRKRNALLSKFGMVGDEVGNVFVKGREGLSEKEAEQFVRAADKAGFYVDVQKSDRWFGENVYIPTSLVPKEVDDSPTVRPIIGDQAKADLSRVENKNGMDILNMTIDKFGNEVNPNGGGTQRQSPPKNSGIVSGAKPQGKPRLIVERSKPEGPPIDISRHNPEIMPRGEVEKGPSLERTIKWMKENVLPSQNRDPDYWSADGIINKKNPGNINLSNRPVVKNADGSISTVRSISVNIDGEEVLIPTVSERGKILSTKEAIEQYKRTGKHLGKFNSPEEATAYAEKLHREQAAKYGNR